MKKHLKRGSMRQILILVALIMAATSVIFGQATTKAKGDSKVMQEVKQTLRQIEEASIRMDKAALESLLADDFTFTNSVGVSSTKPQHIDAFAPTKFNMKSFNLEDEKVRIYGNTAIVNNRTQREFQIAGRNMSGRVQSLMVLVKKDGKWQLVAQQDTPIAQARPQ